MLMPQGGNVTGTPRQLTQFLTRLCQQCLQHFSGTKIPDQTSQSTENQTVRDLVKETAVVVTETAFWSDSTPKMMFPLLSDTNFPFYLSQH